MVDVQDNKYPGLAQGPIDHQSSLIVNATFISTGPLRVGVIGDSVFLLAPPAVGLLPEVDFVNSVAQERLVYGITVGGDLEGTYPKTGDVVNFSSQDSDVIALNGDTVRVCTQGRCVARVNTDPSNSPIAIGDALQAISNGELALAATGNIIIARALEAVPATGVNTVSYIAVDVQREWELS